MLFPLPEVQPVDDALGGRLVDLLADRDRVGQGAQEAQHGGGGETTVRRETEEEWREGKEEREWRIPLHGFQTLLANLLKHSTQYEFNQGKSL